MSLFWRYTHGEWENEKYTHGEWEEDEVDSQTQSERVICWSIKMMQLQLEDSY